METFHLTLQFHSSLSTVLASFSSLFWFKSWFYCSTVLVWSHCSRQPFFQLQQAAVFTLQYGNKHNSKSAGCVNRIVFANMFTTTTLYVSVNIVLLPPSGQKVNHQCFNSIRRMVFHNLTIYVIHLRYSDIYIFLNNASSAYSLINIH